MPQPLVCAPESITKSKKENKLPLRPEGVEALRSIRPVDAAPFQWVMLTILTMASSYVPEAQQRYQVVTQGNLVIKLDKKTGQSWMLDKPAYGQPLQWIPVREIQR